MSILISLTELESALLHSLPATCHMEDEAFVALINRAAESLYTKVSTEGMLEEIEDVTITDGMIVLDTTTHYNVLAVKIDCVSHRIIPLVDVWGLDDAGWDSFVDMGFDPNNFTNRLYRVPKRIKDADHTTMQFDILAKKKLSPLKESGDLLMVSSLSAIKNALIAVIHEDNSDPDQARRYWQLAEEDAKGSADEFRGAVVPTISFADSALTDVHQNLI